MDNNSKLHTEIGLAVNRAKKQLYKRHREGMKIGDSVDLFMAELNDSLNEVAPCEPVDEFVTVTLPNGKQVELSGDAVEMASTKNTAKEEVNYKTIEQWARDCIQGFDEKQELAVVTLLHHLSRSETAASDASTALYAAFRECSGLHDRSIELVIAGDVQ